MIEKTEIILWRRKYLGDIRRYREESRPIYYLDETWINAGDVPSRVWCDKSIVSARDATSRASPLGLPPLKDSSPGDRPISKKKRSSARR